MAREGSPVRDVDPVSLPEEALYERSLRPKTFADYVGQHRVVDNLKVFVEAARRRGDALDHALFCGPPGLGKTSLAYILAHELGVNITITSGPALEHKGDLAGILTNLNARDVLFIDEIHRLNPAVEENLYPAMEDYQFDIVIGEGPGARSMKLPLQRFTLIGATTRTGLLTGPLRDRFGIVARLDYYAPDELYEIVRRSARILDVHIDESGAREIARRARGTPRVANRLLRRVRDFAEVEGDGKVTRTVAAASLGRLEVDEAGLDPMDRRILAALIGRFGGGPVGVESIAAAVSEEAQTIEDVFEPFLIQEGYLSRTPRGRVATERAYKHLGRAPPVRPQGALF